MAFLVSLLWCTKQHYFQLFFFSCKSVKSTESLICLFFLPVDQIQQLCVCAEIMCTSPGPYCDFHAMTALKLCVLIGWCSKSMCASSNATKCVGAASKSGVLSRNLFGSTLQALSWGIGHGGYHKWERCWLQWEAEDVKLADDHKYTALARQWKTCTSSKKNLADDHKHCTSKTVQNFHIKQKENREATLCAQ